MALIFYRVVDRIPRIAPENQHQFAAVRTGEKRPPMKGEWYISGAIPEAYRAPNDLTHDHVIARIVRRPADDDTQHLIEVATYAVADFRVLAQEAGETEERTSPALRAAARLAEALRPFTEGVR